MGQDAVHVEGEVVEGHDEQEGEVEEKRSILQHTVHEHDIYSGIFGKSFTQEHHRREHSQDAPPTRSYNQYEYPRDNPQPQQSLHFVNFFENQKAAGMPDAPNYGYISSRIYLEKYSYDT